jgi:spore maturation protein CgeB
MSYSIVRITNLYNEYIRQYDNTYPHIQEKTFKEQYEHLRNDSNDLVSSTSKCLSKLGVNTFDIFTNAIHLQNQWKIENKSNKSGKELIFEQIKAFQPDVLWLDDITLIDEKWISHVRENVTSIKLITGHLCAPYSPENLKNLKALDFLVTCTPCLRDEFEKHGIKSYLFYHAFEETLLDKIKSLNDYPETDVLFAGSLYTGGGFHRTRIEYIEEFLKQKLPLKIYGATDATSKIFSKMVMYYTVNTARKLGGESLLQQIPLLRKYQPYGDTPVRFYSKRLRKNLLSPVYGLAQFKLLSNSKLCFNIHGEIARGCAGNARLFEATGVGTCLVTDWKQNLPELFIPDVEVVTYRSKEECVDKIKWLLQNPSEIEKVAKAGQLRTLKDHTVTKRAATIDDLIRSKLKA